VLPWGQVWPQIENNLNYFERTTNYVCCPFKKLQNIELTIDDNFFVYSCCISHKKFIKYNSEVMSVTIGTLLGDGWIEIHNRGTGVYTLKQHANQKDWLYWLHEFYSKHKMCNPSIPSKYPILNKKTKKIKCYLKFKTYPDDLFTELHALFYHEIKTKSGFFRLSKKVPECIDLYLTPLAISCWFADDGLILKSCLKGQAKLGLSNKEDTDVFLYRASFCTDCFDSKSIEILINALKKKYNITAYTYEVKRKNQKYTRIMIDTQSMPTFVALIKPYLHISMYHKLRYFKLKDVG